MIDDTKHHIIATAASVEKDLKDKGLNVETAKQVRARRVRSAAARSRGRATRPC